jgi:hypothetical protein
MDRQFERGSEGTGNKVRITQWRQIDKPNTVLVSAYEGFGRCESNCRLSDATRAYNRDEPVLWHLSQESID